MDENNIKRFFGICAFVAFIVIVLRERRANYAYEYNIFYKVPLPCLRHRQILYLNGNIHILCRSGTLGF